MAKLPERAPPPLTSSERAERMLVQAAIAKIQAGQTPSPAETRALKKFEREQEERQRWEHYRTVSKKDYLLMAGRSAKVVREQASRHGLPYPLDEPKAKISLPAVLRWLHDFLAENKWRLLAPGDDDPMMVGSGKDSPALERYRLAKAELTEFDLAERRGTLVAVDEVLVWYHAEVAEPIRKALETLELRHGKEAVDLVTPALQAADAAVSTRLQQDAADHDNHA